MLVIFAGGQGYAQQEFQPNEGIISEYNSYEEGNGDGDLVEMVEMEKGLSVTNLSATQGNALYFTINVWETVSELILKMYGGTGDADIYVKYGSTPTLSDYDYRPYQGGNDETVEIPYPPSGIWHIMIHAYESFDDVTLKIGIYEPKYQLLCGSLGTPLPTIRVWLHAHNKYRCMHGVPPVMWSEALAKGAQTCVNNNKGKEFKHTLGVPECGSMGASSPEDAVDGWYSEEKYYDYNTGTKKGDAPKYESIGHFKQVVGKNIEKIGCAYCSTCTVYVGGAKYTGLYVCHYDAFGGNVPKPKKKEAECKPYAVNYCNYSLGGQGKWESGTTKCWQIDGNPDYGNDTGRDCSVCWLSSGSSPPVTAYGERTPRLAGAWSSVKGIAWISIGWPLKWTPKGCWRLRGYSGQKIMQCPSIAPYPLVRGVRVGGFSACWEQLDSSGSGTGIFFCDY